MVDFIFFLMFCTNFTCFAGQWVCGTPYADIPEVELLVSAFNIYEMKKQYLCHRLMFVIKYNNIW